MTKRQRTVLKVLGMLSGTLINIGDIIFVVWLAQAITQFEAHNSYPFVGLRGALCLLLIYLTSLAVYLQEVRIRKKHEQ